jgi:hypothetical protein
MAERPTIYLSNAGSKRTPGHHGPGRMLCAMANPWRWERGDGLCRLCSPLPLDLEAVQTGHLSIPGYRDRCEAAFSLREVTRYYPPGTLFFRDWISGDPSVVRPDDTLICGCARWEPDRERAHPCHLELLAPYLSRAGWAVVLWGRAYDPAAHTPESFGWPALEVSNG